MLPTKQIDIVHPLFNGFNLVPFNPTNPNFNLNAAWWMAECSRLAYKDPDVETINATTLAGFTGIQFFSKSEMAAYVLYNDQIVVVTFRGTNPEQLHDDFIDLNMVLSHDGVSLEHSGFRNALDILWDDIKAYIQPLLATRALWYTGHSLGAAMATIAAKRITGLVCYNFGCPRVGDKNFVAAVKTPVFRFIRNNDIVTRIPLPIFYRHMPEFYYIGNDNSIYHNPRTLDCFTRNGLSSMWYYIIGLIATRATLINAIHDHDMNNYSTYVWNNINMGVKA